MKQNKGITMVALVITIVVLLIIVGISIGTGSNVIKASQLENLKTNMLLIKVKAKEHVENANFQLGTNFETADNKETRIANAKEELKGEELKDSSIFDNGININQDKLTSDNSNYIYYYKLSTNDLSDMGLSKVDSDDKNGWYIIKYDIKNLETEIYNTLGFENNGEKYYSLTEMQNINL